MWKMTWIQLMNRWRSNVWVCVEVLGVVHGGLLLRGDL
mgnify:CR=1 FL=1